MTGYPGSGCFDLEGDGLGIVIGDGEGAFDDLCERSWKPCELGEELWGEGRYF